MGQMEKSLFNTEHPINPPMRMQLYLFILLFRAKDEVNEDVAGYLQEVPEETIFVNQKHSATWFVWRIGLVYAT